MTGVDLEIRRLDVELMDDPELDRGQHLAALEALARVNRVSFAARRVWREISRLARASAEPIRVLDIACGGGDVMAAVARRAGRRGVAVELAGCDVSPLALEAARDTARRCGVGEPTLRFFELDVLTDDIPEGYDLVCSSLFLHHLPEDKATTLLQTMAATTSGSLLIQDLRRTHLGYLFAFVGLHTLTRSDVARSDGLTSVRSAFTMAEAARLCANGGLDDAEVRPCWPQRFTIRWSRA